mmetsp:Transcript_55121/g.87948  ORF Transcript_55121/g.87948 Transcript_55121/m.87948 type:complete len:602 (+) Transcript_55121:89-1894(+)
MQSPLQIDVESVGRSFLIHYLQSIVYNASHDTLTHHKSKQHTKKQKKKKKKPSIEVQIDWDCPLDDYYALLGIKQYEMNISQDALKRAYRKVSLLMHPDKAPQEHRKQAEARYKLVQTAFDTLSDPYEKLKYDSALEFDDDIPMDHDMAKFAVNSSEELQEIIKMPSDLEEDSDYEENVKLYGSTEMDRRIHVKEDEFYAFFAPFFTKWGRLSKKKMPALGDQHSSDEYVEKFYKTWRAFKSWRLFLHEDEIKDNVFDLNNAENQKEKKWMMKENEILQAPFKKEESLSVQNLVENAYIRDPRITRMLKREKEEFLRELKQKKDARLKKQRERDEWRRKMKEQEDKEKQQKLEAERAKIREMEEKRKELTEVPLKLRTLCNDPFFLNSHIKGKHIDTVCFHANIDDIKRILNGKTKEEQLKIFDEVLLNAKKLEKEKKRAEKERKKKEELEKQQKAGKPWTEQEIASLVNAVGRYPGGTGERWQKIQRAVGKQRSVDDIIAKVKEMTKKGRNKKPKSEKSGKEKKSKNVKKQQNDEEEEDENAWSKEQQSALESALRAVRALPATEKWDKVAEMVPGKTKQQCVERFKWIRAQLLAQQQKK